MFIICKYSKGMLPPEATLRVQYVSKFWAGNPQNLSLWRVWSVTETSEHCVRSTAFTLYIPPA